MSERLKNKLGDELYNQIIAKGVKENEIDLVDGWIPKDRFNEVSKELKLQKEKVTTLEGQVAKQGDLVKDNETLKKQFETMKTDYSTQLTNKDAEIQNIYKVTKIENALIKEGAKFPELLMKQIDLGKLTLENDNILGLVDVITGLKTNYADLFITKSANSNNDTKGSSTNNDPENKDFNWDDAFKNM